MDLRRAKHPLDYTHVRPGSTVAGKESGSEKSDCFSGVGGGSRIQLIKKNRNITLLYQPVLR
ncbi:MAG TPA: hypothetical protein VGN17_02780 [Bryobacteraceae bacterium]